MQSIQRYTKLAAVHLETGEFRPDIGKPGSPRIFTVEAVEGGSFRLFQVGTYENPLWFSKQTLRPFLSQHSPRSNVFKVWKNYKLGIAE